MIAAMQGADLAAATRRGEVDRHLEAQIPEAALRSFLLQNLVMEDGRLRWRINLDALAANLAVLTGYPDNLVGRRYDGPALFLAGAESDYLLPDYHGAIRALFPQAEIGVIEGAGHWVHAERPQAFLERVQVFLI
jgi:pimeloyl-ACP methyl ester carboxylesterase